MEDNESEIVLSNPFGYFELNIAYVPIYIRGSPEFWSEQTGRMTIRSEAGCEPVTVEKLRAGIARRAWSRRESALLARN